MRPDMYIQSEDPADEAPVRDLPGWIKPLTLLIVLGLLGAGIATWAAGLPRHGWEHDIDAGFDKATDDGRPVFVFFTADWCPPCRRLKQGVLNDPEVMDGLAENYVLVKVDLTNRRGPNNGIAQEFGVSGIPTVVLMDMETGEYDRFTGGGSAMATWIRGASDQ